MGMGAIDLIVQQLCQIKYFILFISLANGVMDIGQGVYVGRMEPRSPQVVF